MKMIEKYMDMGVFSENAAFEYLIANLKDTIRTYDFFVAWDKVFQNVSQIEISLNILNSLIGKGDIAIKLKELIKTYPEIVPVIPILIAVRDKNIKVADWGGDIQYSFIKHKQYTNEEIDKIVLFVHKCGLFQILADKRIKNLVDYSIGVEVGLDTNARKNRSGDAMESLSEVYVKAVCERHNLEYLVQATADDIKLKFGKEIKIDKANRHFDFVIDTPDKLYLIEVNYYGGGGSKLKSVAGEFKGLFELVNNDTTGFIWITDGKGWHTARRPLLETFSTTDFVMNIKMIEDGLLEEVVTKGL